MTEPGAGRGPDSGTPWFGLFLPQLRMSFPTILERTLAAEAAGFDSVWLMDHLAAPAAPEHDTFEGWTLAAALAVRTTTIRIGHLVTCDPFRHPAVLAKMAATVDVLSEGRLELGLGWGSVERELETYGIGGRAGRRRAPRACARRSRSSTSCSRASPSTTTASSTACRARSGGRSPASCRARRCTSAAPGRSSRCRWCATTRTGGTARRTRSTAWTSCAPWRATPASRCSTRRARPGCRDRAETVATAERRFGTWGGLVAGEADEVADALAAEAAAGVEGFVVQLTDFGDPRDRRPLHGRGRPDGPLRLTPKLLASASRCGGSRGPGPGRRGPKRGRPSGS